MVLFHFPGREVAFGRVDQAGPGGALVVVHRDHRGGFFHRRQRADLFQRAFPGFAPGQTAVNGDGAAIRYRAAARRGEENLGNGQGAFAEEFVIAQLVRKLFQLGENGRHFEDGVIAALRGGAVAADALNFHADLHTPTLAAVNLAVGGFGADDKFRTNAGLFNNVLPAQAVAILLLNGTGHQQGIFIFQAQIFNDFTGVNHGGHSALLVRRAASADQLIGLHTFVRVKVPVFDIANTDGINVRIHCQQTRTVADVAQHVAHRIDFNFIEADFFHLFFNAVYHTLLIAAFAGDSDHIAQETGHLFFVLF